MWTFGGSGRQGGSRIPHGRPSGKLSAMASRGKKIAATIGCVLAIATVVACRQQISATPLREDPELAKRLADQDEQTKQFEAARDMTQEQADALEQRIAVNPEDFDARRQLVTYYRTSSKVPGTRKCLAFGATRCG